MMEPVRHILCPTDFSETSDHALRLAFELSERLGATLTVLHLYHGLSHVFPDDRAPDYQQVMEQTKRAAYQALLDSLTRCLPERAKPIPALAEGDSYRQCLAEAKRIGADLIVLGTHGRSGIAHALLGSFAERVVRESDVPVLTVRKP